MSHIAILGAGRVASVLAPKLAGANHRVVIGVRDPEAAPDWLTPPLTRTTLSAAAAGADIVINATPGETSLERLAGLSAELAGKVLIDVTNAVERGADGMPGVLKYPNSSLAEQLQQALPRTRVVKTLNTMLFTVMADPDSLATPATVFVSGDDSAAKDTVRNLLIDLGWQPDAILDLGGIRTARGPEAAVLFVPDVLKARGFTPFAISVVS